MALHTFEFRGFEGIFLANPASTCMIAQVMTIQGPVEPLLARLPLALARTFNKHPRMRTRQCPSDQVGNLFKGQIEPLVTAQELVQGDYFQVVHLNRQDEWQERICAQCELEYDRRQRFGFRLEVLLVQPKAQRPDPNCSANQQLQLVLYSDHCMSDARSSFAILHSILEEACGESSKAMDDLQARKFPPSVYKIRCVWWSIKSIFAWLVVKVLARPLLKMVASLYKPCLPIEASQQDTYSREFLHPVRNKSFGFFASGREDNLQKALAKCRQERVTLYGALMASIVAVHSRITQQFGVEEAAQQETSSSSSPIKLHLGYAYDLRKRLKPQLQDDDVGSFSIGGGVDFMRDQGVSRTSRFWDVARRIKQDTETSIEGIKGYLTVYLCDEIAKMTANRTVPDYTAHKSLGGDVLLSNIGRYDYPTRFEMKHCHPPQETDGKTSSSQEQVVLPRVPPLVYSIRSVHNYAAIPTMTHCCNIWITSLQGMHYTMMYKWEHVTAAAFFKNAIKCFEQIGDIPADATLHEVVQGVE